MRWLQKKSIWMVLMCAGMILGTGLTAFASGSLKIRLENGDKNSWTEEIQAPSVTVNYSDEVPEWSKAVDRWEPGNKVTGTMRISGSYSKADCAVYGGSLVSVKAEDGETVIKISYIPVAKLGSTERAGWSDDTKTKATWKKVPFASRYQVVLYREGGSWVKSLTTSSNSVDLLQYMEGGYQYYYTVKAILKDSSEEEYLKEGDVVTSDDSIVQELGDTAGTWKEYQEGKKYRGEDGSFVTGSWRLISGKWYYFNHEGYAVTGWNLLNGKWYYMGDDAQMATGWQLINEKWYYLNADGDMAIGWIQPQPGRWFYLYGDGSMAANTKVDGIYQVDGDGLWIQE